MADTIINVNYFAEAESAGVVDDPSNYTLIMSADFVNGVYELNGSPSTLTALFNGTDPSGFDAGGMQVHFSGSNWPTASAALLSALFAGMDNGLTIVYEVDYNGVHDETYMFFLSDNADIDNATNYIEWYVDGGFPSGNDQDSWFPDFADPWNRAYTAVDGWDGVDLKGVVRTALVLSRSNGTDYEYEISYNGAFQEALGTTTYTQKSKLGTLSGFPIGGYQPWAYGFSQTTTRITKLKIYEAMSSQAAQIASAEGLPLTMYVTPTTDAKKDFTFPSFKCYAGGGKPPYHFFIETGTLPAGLSLDEVTGVVSGTPTALGTSAGISIRCSDSLGDDAVSATFSITVRERILIMTDTKFTSSTTVTGVNFGEAHADRWIIVTSKFGTITGMTIGGVTARTVTTGNVKTWWAKVPTGTSGDIVLTGSTGTSVPYAVFAFYGAGLALHDSRSGTSGTNITISNIKQRSDGFFLAFADFTTLSSPTITFTGADPVRLWDRGLGNQVSFRFGQKYTDTDSGSSDVVIAASTSVGGSLLSFMETGPELIGTSTIAYLTSGTTRSTVVPSAVQTNDLMLVAIFHRSALTSIPSGWTLVATEDCTAIGVTQYCSVYKKNAGSGDAGTTITWTQTSAGRMAAQLLAWRSAAGTLSVLNSATSSQDADTISSNVHDFPEVTGTANDQIFFIAESSIQGQASLTTVTVPEEYFLSSTASSNDNRMATAWRLGDTGETSSGQFTTSLSGTLENGAAKVAVLIGL